MSRFSQTDGGKRGEELSALYSSNDATYRSSSTRAYLDETPSLKKLVNDALAACGKDPLKYEPWP